jgi:hypothetical protein
MAVPDDRLSTADVHGSGAGGATARAHDGPAPARYGGGGGLGENRCVAEVARSHQVSWPTDRQDGAAFGAAGALVGAGSRHQGEERVVVGRRITLVPQWIEPRRTW